jgi:hypothetical protein
MPIANVWSIACRDCPYTRTVGRARLNAGRLARMHAHKFPDHTIEVREHVVRHVWAGYTPKLVELPGDVPPF